MREQIFWLVDFFRGQPVRKHYKELGAILKDPFGDLASSIRQKALSELLSHANKTVPFYKEISPSKFADFPVIDKKRIQDDFDSFKSAKFDTENLFKVATSGSTGVPFILFHDQRKRNRNTADVLYFMEKTGYRIGNKFFELEVWRKHNQRSRLRNFLQNSIQFDISKLTDERIDEMLELIKNTNQEINILGFASALETICKYLDEKKQTAKFKNIKGIIANSEYLSDYTRDAVERHFGSPIYSRYSNEEIGIIGHQTNTSGTAFELNWASYFIEILDMQEDIPAKKGSMGRLVITDLYNYSMPLIRYDTGDVGIFDERGQQFLKVVEGRKMDMVFDTSGNILSSHVVYTKFLAYYDLLNQYQFIQTGKKDYTIRLNAKVKFDREEELIKSVKEDFGQDANIKVEYVMEIPPLSSGKRRKVINRMVFK
ncbi:phenylacetate--CoA ligase family protein [Flagellimonas nanhaiensis]|uniref:Phenylacetate--CoA ligase family protein n=1 Tax=Flagellimonas nanhaiensis TaxID=2292706 RepID=A0A371JVX4_9FLAO|nr:phenylacetate--CoA ligase family protein [Allomuricauda nanhaiensis]RDY61964.1 phenylacetate--CoA ligase family protein [Allomuricauda nanhaiensis]